MKRFLSSFAVLFCTTVLFAQAPPGIDGNRWGGGTASAQPQGFAQGAPLTLTWGFMATGTPIDDSGSGGSANAPNNLPAFLNGIYGTQATWQPLFQSTFDRWSSISGLTYVFEAADDGAAWPAGGVLGQRADVRIGGKAIDGNSGVLAYNYFPTTSDMVIDTTDNFYANNLANNSRALRNVVTHEHGHGLGMNHVQTSGTSNMLMEPFINTAFDGPQFHDILVAQRAYGDANEKSFAGLGNDVSARATSLGAAISIGQNRTVGNSPKINMANNNSVVAFTAVDFVSIDDNTDTDFYSFTIATPGRITLLLEALGITYDAHPQGGSFFSFNSRNRSDMTLSLIGTDGTTVLFTANNTGLGGDETLSFDLLVAGTYFARITGVDNPDATTLDTQFYALTASLAAIPEPTTVAMLGTLGFAGYAAWRHRRRQARKMQDVPLSRI